MPMWFVVAIAAASLAVWLYLVGAHGAFWRASERDDRGQPPPPAAWPEIVAVIPARDEADSIGDTVRSLLAQDYPSRLSIVLVDDQSTDGTAAIATDAAAAMQASPRLTVLSGQPRPAGWSGKVWAMHQGVEHLAGSAPPYLLFTDADIAYDRDALRHLTARAVAHRLVLTSLMVKLRCVSLAERMFIPAFIFFFQMLYPFRWVNRPGHRVAAAAGGCMLVRHDALVAAGGLSAIRGVLIDDCALGRNLKTAGPIWLGLTERVRSLRPYHHVGDIRRMVVRTAYDQLNYSPLLLAGTVGGLALTYLAPPLLALFASGWAQPIGALAWGLMALAYQPTLRLYRRSPLWGLALPGIALAYMAFTLDSAYQHARGRGGLWKGRVQARTSGLR
jgi:hopene-associated glycosyltransferase HpnB